MAKTSALGLAMLCVVLAISPIMVRSNSEKEILLYATTIINGPMANIVVVAGPGPGPLPPINSNAFGVIKVIDAVLTESPDSNSPPIGKLEGIIVSSSKDGTTVYVSESAIIENGKNKAGTLQIQGSLRRDPLGSSANGEAAVPGGTGAYRYMGGYVVIQTVRQTPNTVVVSLKFRIKEFDD